MNMKKIGVLIKEISENGIKTFLKESSAVFIVRYSGLSGPDLNTLRQNLKSVNSALFVVKNSVAKRALSDSEKKVLIKSIAGPCGLVFIKEEPVDVSRVLCNFSKDHGQLKLEGGFLKDKFLDNNDIESMARLPSKEILRAQAVMLLNSPISGLVTVLHQTLKKFVYCLEQIKQKKAN